MTYRPCLAYHLYDEQQKRETVSILIGKKRGTMKNKQNCGQSRLFFPFVSSFLFFGEWKRRKRQRTHATKLRKVILGSLVLLILIDPLVKVGLEEVKLLRFLEQTRPVLLLQLLLLKLHLNVLGGVVDLGLRGVDFGVKFQLDMVLAFQGVRGTGKGQTRGFEIELKIILGNIRDVNGQVDEVLGSIAGR